MRSHLARPAVVAALLALGFAGASAWLAVTQISGTSMAFAGISKGSDRADLIAYLNTLADNPAPLPTAPAPAAEQPKNGPAANPAPAPGAAPKH